jgi:hypothetical protein
MKVESRHVMSKKFLSAGDVLINPDLLAYALVEDDGVEGPRLRLGFSAPAGGRSDVVVVGEAASEILRWLRLNSEFLSRNGGFAPNSPTRHVHREYQRVAPSIPVQERPMGLGRSPELVGRY